MKSKTLRNAVLVLIAIMMAIMTFAREELKIGLAYITFVVWSIWAIVKLLVPFIRERREQREVQRLRQRYATDAHYKRYDDVADTTLLRHVNHRISDYLKKSYPKATWEWCDKNPELIVVKGGTGRIRVYGVADFNYADVIFGRNAEISINMMKFVSMDDFGNETSKSTKSTRTKSKQDNTEQAGTEQPNRESVDPQIWYEQKGRAVLENIISELNSRGHSSLTIKDDGEIYIMQADKQVRQARLAGMPEKSKWGKLSRVFHSEGLAAEVKEDTMVLTW